MPCWCWAGRSAGASTEIERALAEARHGDRIIRTGYLPDAAVPALLRQSTVVAYPALEEGFGLPALEALACGASVDHDRGDGDGRNGAGGRVPGPARR